MVSNWFIGSIFGRERKSFPVSPFEWMVLRVGQLLNICIIKNIERLRCLSFLHC